MSEVGDERSRDSVRGQYLFRQVLIALLGFFFLFLFYDVCDDIDGLSDTVSSNISFFVDSIKVVNYQNEKRGVTKEIKQVINKKKKIFYTGYPPEKRASDN